MLPEWSESERLAGERETLGLYLTGHPVAACEDELKQIVSTRLADLASETPAETGWGQPRRSVRIAGLVVDLRKRANRVMLTLDDRSGRIEVTLFEELYQSLRNIIAKDAILIVDGNLRYDEFSERWRVHGRAGDGHRSGARAVRASHRCAVVAEDRQWTGAD